MVLKLMWQQRFKLLLDTMNFICAVQKRMCVALKTQSCAKLFLFCFVFIQTESKKSTAGPENSQLNITYLSPAKGKKWLDSGILEYFIMLHAN